MDVPARMEIMVVMMLPQTKTRTSEWTAKTATVLTLTLALLLLLLPAAALGQPSQLADLSELKLVATSAEVVDSIPLSGGEFTFKPKSGFKLVIVTLTGSVTRPCRVAMTPFAFMAVYQEEVTRFGERRLETKFEPAHHIAAGDRWAASIETAYSRPLPSESVRLAVTLPENVTDFWIAYPTFAKGKLLVAAKKPQP
jgi:hypothetical protein